MFDYDDSVNLAFDAKIAGKKLVTAKHELLTKTGEFLFLAHSERELALRMQMVEEDIEKVAYRKLSNVSDSKAKLARAVFDEWALRHASCTMCKTALDSGKAHVVKDALEGGAIGTFIPGIGNAAGAAIGAGLGIGHALKEEEKKKAEASTKFADNNQVTPGSMGSNAVNGFCHGCGSFLGGLAMDAMLASKKTAHDHSVFCSSCQSDPSQIGCTACKESLSR
jgi:hypothetical protein